MTKNNQNNQPTIQGLQNEIAELKKLVTTLVGAPSSTQQSAKTQTDFIGWGTPEHAGLLGIVPVEDEKDLLPGDISFRSPKTDNLYKLADPITPFMSFSRPNTIALLVLRQKVSSFESGQPQVPEDAPPLMTFGQLLPGMTVEGQGHTI